MGDSASVQITPDQDANKAPEGHDQAMVDKAEGKSSDADANKDMLAGKFKDQDALVEGYKNAESMIGKQSTQIKELNDRLAELEKGKTSDADATGAQDEDDNASDQGKADEGFNFKKYETEFYENEKISEASYKELEKAGFDRQTIDTYIEGQKALRDNFRKEAFSAVGGEDNFNALAEWAVDNLSEAEVDSYEKMLADRDMTTVQTALKTLANLKAEADGSHPDLVQGGPSSAGSDVFENMQQVSAAMRDPLYKSDPAFRAKVVAKIGRSNL